MDISLVYTPAPGGGLGLFDLAMNGSDLAQGNDLLSAVLLSLFTNRLAEPDDVLPDSTQDRQGWWGDDFAAVEGDLIGSRLWLLCREKQTNETLVQAQEYVTEALQWLIDDGVVASINCNVTFPRMNWLGIQIQFIHSDGTSSQYEFLWDQIQNQFMQN